MLPGAGAGARVVVKTQVVPVMEAPWLSVATTNQKWGVLWSRMPGSQAGVAASSQVRRSSGVLSPASK